MEVKAVQRDLRVAAGKGVSRLLVPFSQINARGQLCVWMAEAARMARVDKSEILRRVRSGYFSSDGSAGAS